MGIIPLILNLIAFAALLFSATPNVRTDYAAYVFFGCLTLSALFTWT
jgi:hypothetical protein